MLKFANMKFIFVICICCLGNGLCATLNDTQTLLKNLLANYDIDVRPVADQLKPVNVSLKAYLKSVQDFEEVQGKISFVVALVVIWHDVNMMWDPTDYGGMSEVTVGYSKVWIPELVLLSPAEAVTPLGRKWNKIRYHWDGYAVWIPVDLIESTCSVNVWNYPFDTQKCVTSFNSLGYEIKEVLLHPANDSLDLSIYQENSLWKISDTKVARSETGRSSQIDLTLVLERKPSFIIINIILPILFLSLLNVLVFVLVPESGERVSYAITVLLSIAVFMTIVSDMLPRSSEPVPLISYALTFDMVLSSLIVLVTIFNLKLYHKDDSEPVPSWLQSVYRVLTYSFRKQPKTEYQFDEENKTTKSKEQKDMPTNMDVKAKREKEPDFSNMGNQPDESPSVETVTWKIISKLVDRVALVSFSLAAGLVFGIFLITTMTHSP